MQNRATRRRRSTAARGALIPLIAVVLLAAVVLPARSGPAGPSPAPEAATPEAEALPSHSETATVRLVLLSTVVTNRRGRPVRGLDQEDFRLFEGGEPREIELFATERDVPISVAFLLDLSGSMRQKGKLQDAKRMIRAFVEALGSEDRFGLIGFADDQVTWITEFTSAADTFLVRLGVQHGYGMTALFDAVAATPELVDRQVRGRRAIVLFTDGIDTASELSELQAVWTARRVDVPIYVLGFTPMPEAMLPRSKRDVLRTLDRFAGETGGKLFAIDTPEDLERAIQRIQDELRFQYVIGFHPRPESWDRSFRPIRLEVDRGGLRVQTRAGYYATP